MEDLKEYLRKNSNGTYSYVGTVRPEHVSDFMIEIPEGADEFKANGRFYKDSDSFFNISAMVWTRSTLKKDAYATLWKRATHPEELPFIDDEPSLNDQYAEIEKVRQSHRTASETADPTIKETLSQRQAQYGDFKDVADTTERLFKTIKDGNSFDDFTNDQRMALYMICSKMARIVNGNPNHKDSWHDIAGYATLIDNELVSEKDMPF